MMASELDPALVSVGGGGGGSGESLTLSRDVKRACELLEKLQKSKYREFFFIVEAGAIAAGAIAAADADATIVRCFCYKTFC